MSLTPKQEAFAVAVAKGATASDAYRHAYDAANMKPETIHEKASRLSAQGKVGARVAELRTPALEATKIDVERWAQETGKYAFGAPSDELKHADKRGYLDMIGKSLGAYEKDNKQRTPNLAIQVSFE